MIICISRVWNQRKRMNIFNQGLFYLKTKISILPWKWSQESTLYSAKQCCRVKHNEAHLEWVNEWNKEKEDCSLIYFHKTVISFQGLVIHSETTNNIAKILVQEQQHSLNSICPNPYQFHHKCPPSSLTCNYYSKIQLIHKNFLFVCNVTKRLHNRSKRTKSTDFTMYKNWTISFFS